MEKTSSQFQFWSVSLNMELDYLLFPNISIFISILSISYYLGYLR